MMKCKRGRHPIDNDLPCQLCLQEDRAQEEKDDAIYESIVRLAKRGKFKPFTNHSTSS